MALKIISPLRLVQTLKNKRDETFTMYSPRCREALIINKKGASLVHKIVTSRVDIERLRRKIKTKKFISLLIDSGYIRDLDDSYPTNKMDIHFPKSTDKRDLPLSALSIELTDSCNLNCKHCYSSFGVGKETKMVPINWVLESIESLNALHVYKIALTGGEAMLHPYFPTIMDFYLKNGFELTIFTNGTNPSLISSLLDKTKDYHYVFKVSLDGTENVHNLIRGNMKSFGKVSDTLRILSKHSNIQVVISTTIMKENIDDLQLLGEYISFNYPNATWTKDLVFPAGNAISEESDCFFSTDDFEYIYERVPEIFETKNMKKNNRIFQKSLRCTGGVTQATLTPTGNLKICNAASTSEFFFKGNVFEDGLESVWVNCGQHVEKYRTENAFSTASCKKCKLKKRCNVKDCRLLAALYMGSPDANNPISCFSAKIGK